MKVGAVLGAWFVALYVVRARLWRIEPNACQAPCEADTRNECPCYRLATVTHLESGITMCLHCYAEIER